MINGGRRLFVLSAFLSSIILVVAAIVILGTSGTNASTCGSAGVAVFPDQDPFDPKISILFLDSMDIGVCEDVTVYVRDITTTTETFRVKMETRNLLNKSGAMWHSTAG